MTTELEALARRAVACPRWRWLDGMHTACRLRVVEGGEDYAIGHRQGSTKDGGGWYDGEAAGMLPDLTDPATLGCLVALVREIHGPSAVARHIGTNGRGGQEWAIYDRAPAVDGYHMAAPALGYWESEIEALVAALETGGGGV
jgi:hypothetical protein